MATETAALAQPLIRLAGIPEAGELIQQPLPLPASIQHQDPDRRLGRLFENLVATAVQQSTNLALVTRNLVIHDGERTIGELDMLVRDLDRDVLMHWEITVKFYIGLSPSHWPGPNPADNFSSRVARLREHQFPLLRHPATQAALQARGLEVSEQRLFSRGRLFYPADRALNAPAEAHPDHARGRWWHCDSLHDMAARWKPLARHHWLNPEPMAGLIADALLPTTGASMLDNDSPWLATRQVIDYVQALNRPLMVLHASHAGLSPQPGFIIPQSWFDNAFKANTTDPTG